MFNSFILRFKRYKHKTSDIGTVPLQNEFVDRTSLKWRFASGKTEEGNYFSQQGYNYDPTSKG